MKELVFLVEELSAKAMLDALLPRILQEGIEFRCIPFEGKQDLEKQMVRKIRAYQNSQARFIIMRDLDSHPNCLVLKQRLRDLCDEAGKAEQCLIRLACTELETFYLADLQAVETALQIHGLSKLQNKQKFRTPDHLGSPSKELKTLTKQRYEKVAGSRAIGQHLDLNNGRSPSFYHLIQAIMRLQSELNASD